MRENLLAKLPVALKSLVGHLVTALVAWGKGAVAEIEVGAAVGHHHPLYLIQSLGDLNSLFHPASYD